MITTVKIFTVVAHVLQFLLKHSGNQANKDLIVLWGFLVRMLAF